MVALRFHFILSTLLFFFLSNLNAQQLLVKGELKDAFNQEPLVGVKVQHDGSAIFVLTDDAGQFEFQDLPSGPQTLIFQKEDLELDRLTIVLPAEGEINLGTIPLNPTTKNNIEDDIPTVNISAEELDAESDDASFSNLLTASRDAFVTTARFVFGARRFRIRGYDSEENSIYINGVPVNSLDNGRVFFTHWSGLNDITRNSDLTIGLDPTEYAFGGVGQAPGGD